MADHFFAEDRVFAVFVRGFADLEDGQAFGGADDGGAVPGADAGVMTERKEVPA